MVKTCSVGDSCVTQDLDLQAVFNSAGERKPMRVSEEQDERSEYAGSGWRGQPVRRSGVTRLRRLRRGRHLLTERSRGGGNGKGGRCLGRHPPSDTQARHWLESERKENRV